MPNNKPFYTSKTLWINVLMAAIFAALDAFGSGASTGTILGTELAANSALRTITKGGISLF